MSGIADQARFPAVIIRSSEAFKRFRQDARDLLDERYRREQTLGSREERVATDGICGPCLRVTSFSSLTTGGEHTIDGRRVPNWREEQLCNCHLRLSSRQRALLHVAMPHLNGDWHRIGVLGSPDALSRFLGERGSVHVWERTDWAVDGGLALPVAAGTLSALLSPDHLHHVPDATAALSACARALAPGGAFAFTIPFHVDEEDTRSDLDELPRRGGRWPTLSARAVHRFGWSLLEKVREAGFADCAAHCYWSEEFGYLGPFNMIFLAFR